MSNDEKSNQPESTEESGNHASNHLVKNRVSIDIRIEGNTLTCKIQPTSNSDPQVKAAAMLYLYEIQDTIHDFLIEGEVVPTPLNYKPKSKIFTRLKTLFTD